MLDICLESDRDLGIMCPVLSACINLYNGPKLPKDDNFRLPHMTTRYIVLDVCKDMILCLVFDQPRKNGPYSDGYLTAFPKDKILHYFKVEGYASNKYVRDCIVDRSKESCDMMLLLGKSATYIYIAGYYCDCDILEHALHISLRSLPSIASDYLQKMQKDLIVKMWAMLQQMQDTRDTRTQNMRTQNMRKRVPYRN